MRGKFIVLEGLDGAGKSSQADAVAAKLRAAGIAALVTREPGGAPLSEKIRELILDGPPAHPVAETMLFLAARREHVERVIAPALRAGTWVVCDRFTDSTYAYQGGGRGVPEALIAGLSPAAEGEAAPDVVYFLDSPMSSTPSRLFTPDSFETEGAKFYRRVRDAYMRRAEAAPNRVMIPRKTLREVTAAIMSDLRRRFKIRPLKRAAKKTKPAGRARG